MKDKIIDYLINNKEHLKELVEPVVIAKEYMLKIDALFSEEIILQFNRKIRNDISNEVCKALACDVESVLIELENINLMEYLR